jgi:uncharacterized membrane protein YkoI
VALAALTAVGSTGGVAYAGDQADERQAAQALADSKISLSQAIAAAEQQTGGKAVGADLENEHGTVHIAVEIASKQGVKTVLIDPQSGQVVGTKTQHEHDGEEND